MANRVVFLVDGFNVYYSIKAAIEDTGKSLKWLDLRALCASYASSAFGKVATLERVEYFSAYANFLVPRKPDVVKRHKVYVSALEASGVKVSMGRFKWKPKWCDACQKEIAGHEEKETDVAMAVRVMELCIQNECETITIVSGDTDLLPVVRSVHRLFPDKQIWVATPYKRFNAQLKDEADGCIKLRRHTYERFQLPDPLIAADGTEIRRPATW